MVNQVLSIPYSREITHVVFMGMGEPLDNIDEVLAACRILTSSWGLSLGPAHITVSTVGITPAVERFLDGSDCNLTLSLFSPFPGERVKVVPVEKVYPANQVLELMKSHSHSKKRRFSIAYVMIHDINDSEVHLEELVRMLKGTSIRVNLLPYHMTPDDSCTPSPGDRIEYFRQRLTLSGISASVRRSRGADISAACGLLAAGLKKQTG
jgi:23S rRNA (adenine2503-C2)-methyltransferase